MNNNQPRENAYFLLGKNTQTTGVGTSIYLTQDKPHDT